MKRFSIFLKENEEVRPLFNKEFNKVAVRYANLALASKAINNHLRGIENYQRMKNDPATRQAASVFGLNPDQKYSNKPEGHFKSPIPTHFFVGESGVKRAVSDVVPHERIKSMAEKAQSGLDQLRTRLVSMNPELGEFKNHLELAQHLSVKGHLTPAGVSRSEYTHPVGRLRRGEDLGARMFGPTVNNKLIPMANEAGPKSNMLLKKLANRGGNVHTNPALHDPDVAGYLGVDQTVHNLSETNRNI